MAAIFGVEQTDAVYCPQRSQSFISNIRDNQNQTLPHLQQTQTDSIVLTNMRHGKSLDNDERLETSGKVKKITLISRKVETEAVRTTH